MSETRKQLGKKEDGRGKHPNSRKNLEKGMAKAGEPSLNPEGRPEGSKNRATIVKKWVEVEGDFKNPISKAAERMTVEDAMVLAMIGAVLTKQNVQAYNAIKDEIYGKLTDSFKHEGDLNFNVNVKVDLAIDKIYGDRDGTN
jgi:hypothetical protein